MAVFERLTLHGHFDRDLRKVGEETPITVAAQSKASLTRTLGSWARIPLKALMSVCVLLFCVYVVLCVGRGLATG
jgi:hypothetical protein